MLPGVDTTPTALTVFIMAMTLYPEVQKKAQAELDHVVGTERLPTFADRGGGVAVHCRSYQGVSSSARLLGRILFKLELSRQEPLTSAQLWLKPWLRLESALSWLESEIY